MKKNYLLFGLVFIIGILLGHSLSFFNDFTASIDYPPSNKQSEFVRACSELNGKELSSQNVHNLGGWCFVGGGLNLCADENIRRVKNNTDPFFNVYQKKQYESTWICAIGKNKDDTIKTWNYYQYK